MAEYIDREELLKDIEDSVRFSIRNGVSAEMRGAAKIVDRIVSAPTVDVVEVVRCKDCKHFTEGMAIGMCKRIEDKPIIPVPFNYFCSYGERKCNNG